jgi:uncharacterized integral membrane protein
MQVFYWVILIVIICVAVFAIQNSSAPPITIKFLTWRVETSLIYTLLGSIGIGVIVTLFLLLPKTIQSSIRSKELKRKIENLETLLHGPAPLNKRGKESEGS